MNPLIFTSKPNNCSGCPVKKIAPLGAKVENICHRIQTRYEVQYTQGDQGRICRVTMRDPGWKT